MTAPTAAQPPADLTDADLALARIYRLLRERARQRRERLQAQANQPQPERVTHGAAQ